MQRIYDAGHIYQDTYSGLYCVGHEAFMQESELVDGKCPEHGPSPSGSRSGTGSSGSRPSRSGCSRSTTSAPTSSCRTSAETKHAASSGGPPGLLALPRGQPWGVPIPWDPEQVVYVWVDALVNYLSALTYAREGEDLVETFWPAARHMIGKDILRFHCVFWPALLMAAGYDVPRQIFVHGYLVLDDRKISKSLGNVIARSTSWRSTASTSALLRGPGGAVRARRERVRGRSARALRA